jgi:hypothetical protein
MKAAPGHGSADGLSSTKSRRSRKTVCGSSRQPPKSSQGRPR